MRGIFVAVCMAIGLAACTTASILNINDAPIGVSAQNKDISAVINGALSGRGWQVAERRPGAIDAFIVVREHRAEITISYDQDSYSIAYRGSENLNQRGRSIHRNYNRWVANLNTDIQRALAAS
jgi:hypothetical protein